MVLDRGEVNRDADVQVGHGGGELADMVENNMVVRVKCRRGSRKSTECRENKDRRRKKETIGGRWFRRSDHLGRFGGRAFPPGR